MVQSGESLVKNGSSLIKTDLYVGLDLLATRVSPGALHNSNERRDVPRRHPGTRDQLIDDIREWLDDTNDPRVVLWLKGSAGTGKTVIADAIASLCSQEKRLLGAFFVSRTAPPESGRNDETKLAPTLAYQIAQNIFFIQGYIGSAVERNPLVFDLDIATQIDSLIIGPLSIRSDEMATSTTPMLILIDALDEFPNKATQARVIQAFSSVMERTPRHIPVKLLITSRPERTIQSAFMAPRMAPLVHTISLNDYTAYVDIRTLLFEGFRDLKRTHPSPDVFPMIWPTEEAIDELVRRSAGQFLYAATLLNYIREDDFDPVQQLQAVLANEPETYISPKDLKPPPDFLDHIYYVFLINKQCAFVALPFFFF
jgi:hypothetical protein